MEHIIFEPFGTVTNDLRCMEKEKTGKVMRNDSFAQALGSTRPPQANNFGVVYRASTVRSLYRQYISQ